MAIHSLEPVFQVLVPLLPTATTAQLTGSIDASAIAGVNYLVVSAPNDDFNFPFTNATQFGFPADAGSQIECLCWPMTMFIVHLRA